MNEVLEEVAGFFAALSRVINPWCDPSEKAAQLARVTLDKITNEDLLIAADAIVNNLKRAGARK